MHDASTATVGRCERAQACAGRLLNLARVMHVFVHHDKRASATRVGMTGKRHRVVKIRGAFGTQGRRRPHGPHQHNWLVVLHNKT
ncbi:hypothetical protein D3C78_1590790 [compost metagenome]